MGKGSLNNHVTAPLHREKPSRATRSRRSLPRVFDRIVRTPNAEADTFVRLRAARLQDKLLAGAARREPSLWPRLQRRIGRRGGGQAAG